jgi:hypothetical protein
MDGRSAAPPRNNAPAWYDVVYGGSTPRSQARWDAEDMACILAEEHVLFDGSRLTAGQQYPQGSLLRVYARYGLDAGHHAVAPCSEYNSENPLTPPCATTLWQLGIATTDHPNPPRRYTPTSEEMELSAQSYYQHG